MTLRKKRYELMVFHGDGRRRLVGDDLGLESATDCFLCLPGLLETRESFAQFAAAVGPYARVLTLDWCGRGDSDRLNAAHDYRMSTYLSDLSVFYAHAVGVVTDVSLHAHGRAPRIHLVGTSMGGLLAVFMASHKPRHLGSLILNDVGPLLPWSGVFSLMTGMTQAVKSTPIDRGGQDLAQQLNIDPALLHAVRQPGHLDLPHETRLAGVDFAATFAQVSAPMLLIRGRSSEIVNDTVVKRLFEIHPLTRVFDCPDSAHPVPYSAAVCEEILRFTNAKRTP